MGPSYGTEVKSPVRVCDSATPIHRIQFQHAMTLCSDERSQEVRIIPNVAVLDSMPIDLRITGYAARFYQGPIDSDGVTSADSIQPYGCNGRDLGAFQMPGGSSEEQNIRFAFFERFDPACVRSGPSAKRKTACIYLHTGFNTT